MWFLPSQLMNLYFRCQWTKTLSSIFFHNCWHCNSWYRQLTLIVKAAEGQLVEASRDPYSHRDIKKTPTTQTLEQPSDFSLHSHTEKKTKKSHDLTQECCMSMVYLHPRHDPGYQPAPEQKPLPYCNPLCHAAPKIFSTPWKLLFFSLFF